MTLTYMNVPLFVLLGNAILALCCGSALAWVAPATKIRNEASSRSTTSPAQPRALSALVTSNKYGDVDSSGNFQEKDIPKSSTVERRRLIKSSLAIASFLPLLIFNSKASATVQRAVGGAETDCRAAGNCWETGQLDGVVGWNWGAKDRCDATDPRCGSDGVLRDELPAGKPIPEVTNKITHVAQITIDVGREETNFLRLGFYGDDCPGSVKQMLQFLTTGISSTSSSALENAVGVKSSPVTLLDGGIVPNLVPGKIVDFGVPSQANAYARSRGLRSAGDSFVPQSKPNQDDTKNDPFPRKHDVAGLISVPAKGIGYGGNGYESEDEAYASAFQITADAVPQMDKANRRVIGQLIDDQSMAFLARLASIPAKKGIKGVIPGQTSGPPLLKVVVYDVDVKKVPNPS